MDRSEDAEGEASGPSVQQFVSLCRTASLLTLLASLPPTPSSPSYLPPSAQESLERSTTGLPEPFSLSTLHSPAPTGWTLPGYVSFPSLPTSHCGLPLRLALFCLLLERGVDPDAESAFTGRTYEEEWDMKKFPRERDEARRRAEEEGRGGGPRRRSIGSWDVLEWLQESVRLLVDELEQEEELKREPEQVMEDEDMVMSPVEEPLDETRIKPDPDVMVLDDLRPPFVKAEPESPQRPPSPPRPLYQKRAVPPPPPPLPAPPPAPTQPTQPDPSKKRLPPHRQNPAPIPCADRLPPPRPVETSTPATASQAGRSPPVSVPSAGQTSPVLPFPPVSSGGRTSALPTAGRTPAIPTTTNSSEGAAAEGLVGESSAARRTPICTSLFEVAPSSLRRRTAVGASAARLPPPAADVGNSAASLPPPSGTVVASVARLPPPTASSTAQPASPPLPTPRPPTLPRAVVIDNLAPVSLPAPKPSPASATPVEVEPSERKPAPSQLAASHTSPRPHPPPSTASPAPSASSTSAHTGTAEPKTTPVPAAAKKRKSRLPAGVSAVKGGPGSEGGGGEGKSASPAPAPMAATNEEGKKEMQSEERPRSLAGSSASQLPAWMSTGQKKDSNASSDEVQQLLLPPASLNRILPSQSSSASRQEARLETPSIPQPAANPLTAKVQGSSIFSLSASPAATSPRTGGAFSTPAGPKAWLAAGSPPSGAASFALALNRSPSWGSFSTSPSKPAGPSAPSSSSPVTIELQRLPSWVSPKILAFWPNHGPSSLSFLSRSQLPSADPLVDQHTLTAPVESTANCRSLPIAKDVQILNKNSSGIPFSGGYHVGRATYSSRDEVERATKVFDGKRVAECEVGEKGVIWREIED
ncbi:hypothetical protein JCM8547_002491 [Rhodosporidiobolus lusitaniae]